MIDYSFKILLLGNPTKKSRDMVKGWFNGAFKEDFKLTIGVNFYKKDVKYNDANVIIQAWDLFSQHSSFKDYLPQFFEGSLGALYIIDDVNNDPLRDLDEWLPIMQYQIGNDLEGYAFLLIRIIQNGEDSPQFDTLIAEKSQWFDEYIEWKFNTRDHVEMVFQKITKLMIENTHLETPFGLRLQGDDYLRKNQYKKAIECYKRALELNPEYEFIKKKLDQL